MYETVNEIHTDFPCDFITSIRFQGFILSHSISAPPSRNDDCTTRKYPIEARYARSVLLQCHRAKYWYHQHNGTDDKKPGRTAGNEKLITDRSKDHC